MAIGWYPSSHGNLEVKDMKLIPKARTTAVLGSLAAQVEFGFEGLKYRREVKDNCIPSEMAVANKMNTNSR